MAKKRAKPQSQTPKPPIVENGGFLRAILAEPDDDTHRLIYADWLDENGQPERAEFIRLQIERARRPFEDPLRGTPGERESALLNAHSEDWLRPLAEQFRLWPHYFTFERGFPGVVHVELERFVQWDDSIWQAVPLTALVLGDMTAANGEYREEGEKERLIRALADKPQLAHFRTLDFGEGCLRLVDVEVLLTSPHLKQLRYLGLTDIGHPDELVRLVTTTTSLPSLTGLNLEANQIGDADTAVLAAAPFVERLVNLCLGNSNLGDVGAEYLASSPRLGNLEYLSLYCTEIGDAGAHALAASPHLARLKGLWLMATHIGDDGQAALRQRFGERVSF